ncbi:GNAT family N-acetyltransferase [Halobacillus locisalis]|uniref:GNAT family N-acetyltransferase n=1 Tax=Halobacillus locisalis TaxID=220753 RepID=A0A838CP67_9BACI|nr:GNAT family N-acetyltransferase [Halobacillus locisalis]MBA2173731.1 GNAT family N-acetyltransferase [Halobacillus locisalis]
MNIRLISFEKDKDKLLEFRKDAQLVSEGTLENYDFAAYLQRMRRRIETNTNGQVFIIENRKVIGQIGAELRGGEGYVNLFYLVPEFRGRGYGRKMVAFAEDFFIKQGVRTYRLRVARSNKQALNLYKKSGLEIVEEDEQECTYIMKRKIPSTVTRGEKTRLVDDR